MQLTSIDWAIVAVYGGVTLVLGFWFTRRAGQSLEEYFVAGRSLPWWLAGTSIAATFFATDAPLATAALVRTRGVFGNWLWWYEAAGFLFLVFFYAKLWRRAEILTDAEFVELRYSGRPATVLRGFSAIFNGVLRNAVVMGWVMLAMVKFTRVLLGWPPWLALVVCIGLALTYTIASGLWGVVVTDLLQFTAAMLGSLTLAGIILVRLGGPAAMAEQIRALPDAPAATLDLIPDPAHLSSLEFVSFLFLIFLLWTRSGQGDGYVAQRLFAAKDERQSLLSSLWFSFAAIVLMTWPWVIVGLGSLLILPIATAGPALAADPELAYPMMIVELMPAGLRGLMVATFLAAFMSTMDTHLCWGASYLVNDVYRRFIKRHATERHYVLASRLAVVVLVLVAAVAGWQMESIRRAWIYVIELTAGVALVWLLRWYWWRVNAWAEVSAMAGSFLLANGMVWAGMLHRIGILSESGMAQVTRFYGGEFDFIRATIILLGCTLIWLIVTLNTAPDEKTRLQTFYRRVRPGGWWGPIAASCPEVTVTHDARRQWLGFGLGLLFVYGSLLGVGYLLTGRPVPGTVATLLSIVGAWAALRLIARDRDVVAPTESEEEPVR
ncbi:MAG: Na+:solute symporter [Gemmatimonadota bacterium]|nr:Na+:solute symporter [Gemmatimonadota bacterium]MDH3368441.1 Na+:solute symporter [Gemmatimonadota bacterium]MDH3479285.1 Na+:solute symporter [Gemmatimonadota bacterium]MDH5549003.1 Na+:solute symporter [Gemmatimonadota bacterium]